MSRFTRLVPLFVVPVLFAACSSAATDTPVSPAAPRHDGGLLVGGNATPPPPDSTTESTSTTSTDDGGNAGGLPESTSKTGLLVGGN